jgi:hypothetical protein
VAIQLLSLGIPCVYYGTEQAFAGPERSERDRFLPDYNVGNPPPDKYLREAMFGPEHPRRHGVAGIGSGAAAVDATLPGFGPFGTVGAHCFNTNAAAFVRIAALVRVRRRVPALRCGRMYPRPISVLGEPFADARAGELIAWSRILDEEEALCVVNGNGGEARGADVLVDAALNGTGAPGGPFDDGHPSFEVIANTAQAAHESRSGAGPYNGPHPIGERVSVQTRDGIAFVAIRGVSSSETLVLINRP